MVFAHMTDSQEHCSISPIITLLNLISALLFTVHSPTAVSELYEVSANARPTFSIAPALHEQHSNGEKLGGF